MRRKIREDGASFYKGTKSGEEKIDYDPCVLDFYSDSVNILSGNYELVVFGCTLRVVIAGKLTNDSFY